MQPARLFAGRYEIEDRIGVGGMGTVYRARHTISRHLVALKVMHPHMAFDNEAVQRFRREAQAPAQIGHEGIVKVIDAGVDADEGSLFLAMELLEGESLRERLARGAISRDDKLALVLGVLDPLAAAHERGYVHRDLKPDNAFIARQPDGSEIIKLLDFGIARQLGHEKLTLTGTAVGTPQYMAPEQALSGRGATAAADIWAIGVMLYEILAGRPPFDGPTPHAVIMNAALQPHAAIDADALGVGPELASLVDRCLAKDPEARPRDAAALRVELSALVPDPRTALAPSGTVHASAPAGPLSHDEMHARTAVSTPPRVRAPAPAMRTETGPGFSIEVPASWERRVSSIPGVELVVVDGAAEEEPPPTLRLKIEPFTGSTREFVDLGLDNMAQIATLHRTVDARLAGHDGVEVEATFHDATVPARSLMRAVVIGNRGVVVTCSAEPGAFGRVQHLFRRALDSVRVDASEAS